MIETVTALLLFLNGTMIEHVYKPNLSACLKSKRIASRELNPERVVFSCKIVKAKIEDRMENMMSNSVNIERLQKDVEKVLSDIEKLKDKQRTFANGSR